MRLFQHDPRPRIDTRGLAQAGGRAHDQVAIIGGQAGSLVSSVMLPAVSTVKRSNRSTACITRGQLVVAVGTLAQDLEDQVDFGRGSQHQGSPRPLQQSDKPYHARPEMVNEV